MSRPPLKPKCKTKNCERRSVVARGLCRNCFASLARLVRMGRTTWEKLEAAGLCSPVHDPANSSSPAVRAAVAAGLLSDSPSTPTPTAAQT
jgi:hypothetical protein